MSLTHVGVESVIAEHLMTVEVRRTLGIPVDGPPLTLEWTSWPQSFGSTNGPWGGIGGRALTRWQVSVGRSASRVAIFAGSDLFAYRVGGDMPEVLDEFLDEAREFSNLPFARLTDLGLTVLAAPLPRTPVPYMVIA